MAERTAKENEKFAESEIDFRMERPEGEPDLRTKAFLRGRHAYGIGAKLSDNPEQDIELREYWADGWKIGEFNAKT